MQSRPRTSLMTAALVSLSVALAACGSSSEDAADTVAETVAVADTSPDTSPAATVAEAADAGATTDFNEADVTFAQNMIPHHEQAVEMATIALDPAREASDAVKDLATRVQGAQDPEIQLMTGWLAAWGQDRAHSMDGMDHSSMDGMEGMMSADDMEALERATGAEFDKMWMTMMIEHHRGAIAMANTQASDGQNADAKELAARIVSAQEAEIAEMERLLAS